MELLRAYSIQAKSFTGLLIFRTKMKMNSILHRHFNIGHILISKK